MVSEIKNGQVIINGEVQQGPLAPFTYQVEIEGKKVEREKSGVWVGKYLYAEKNTNKLQVFPLDTPIDQLDSAQPLLEIPDFDFDSPTAGQDLGIPLGMTPTGEEARTFPTNTDIKGGKLYRLGNSFAAYADFGGFTTGIEHFDSRGESLGYLLGDSNIEVFTPTNIFNADGSVRAALFPQRVDNTQLKLTRLDIETGQLDTITIAQNGVTDNVAYTADPVQSCITSDGNNFYFQYNRVSFPGGKMAVERVVQEFNPDSLSLGTEQVFSTNDPALNNFGGFSSLDRSPSSIVLDNGVTVSLDRNRLTVDTPILAPMPEAQIPYGVIASAGGTTDLPIPPDGRQGIVYLQPEAVAKLPAGPAVWTVVSHGGGLVDLTNLGVSNEALIAGINGQGTSSTVTLNGPNGEVILKFPISPADLIARINGTFTGIGERTSTTTTTSTLTSPSTSITTAEKTTTTNDRLSSATSTSNTATTSTTKTKEVTASPTSTTAAVTQSSTSSAALNLTSTATQVVSSSSTAPEQIESSTTTTAGASSSTTADETTTRSQDSTPHDETTNNTPPPNNNNTTRRPTNPPQTVGNSGLDTAAVSGIIGVAVVAVVATGLYVTGLGKRFYNWATGKSGNVELPPAQPRADAERGDNLRSDATLEEPEPQPQLQMEEVAAAPAATAQATDRPSSSAKTKGGGKAKTPSASQLLGDSDEERETRV